MTEAFRIGVMLCGQIPKDVQGTYGTYEKMFDHLFGQLPVKPELVFYDVTAGEYPARPGDCNGYVSSGSALSVCSPQSWYGELCRFLHRLQNEKIPFVGICFGHQFIAHMFGGKVEPAGNGWGIGVHDVTVVAREEWMLPRRKTLSLVALHQDQVVRMPPGSKLLATSDHCPVSMFRFGKVTGKNPEGTQTMRGHSRASFWK